VRNKKGNGSCFVFLVSFFLAPMAWIKVRPMCLSMPLEALGGLHHRGKVGRKILSNAKLSRGQGQ